MIPRLVACALSASTALLALASDEPLELVRPAVLAAVLRAPSQRADAIVRLGVWIERRVRTGGGALEPATLELDELLRDVAQLEERHPERRADALEVLLRLAVLGAQADASAPSGPAELGRAELARRLDRSPDGAAARLLSTALTEPKSEPAERVVVARLLAGRYVDGTLGPLLAAARSEDSLLRHAAQLALAGWPAVGLETFFLDELEQGGGSMAAIRAHFLATREQLGSQALVQLRAVAGRMLLAEDWRVAARVRPLLSILETWDSVPLLIESLRVWNRRAASGTGSRRIQHELVLELQRVSGRSLGDDPERWQAWWARVHEGSVALPEQEPAPEEHTVASFFGLPVVSDRVLFVLDRSGSMETPLGTGTDKTRYDEAVVQLLSYLERAGPSTRFDVLLFNDRQERWSSSLIEATRANRERLARWVRRQPVGGGTRLREAVLDAACYKNGRLQLDCLQADTVVVLCDGETETGPDWVGPWLEEIADESQLLFLCVQVGGRGDGTLEALAGADGAFLHVE